MYQLTMIYNSKTVYYFEFLVSYTGFINLLNEIKNSIPGKCLVFNFTKNSSIGDLITQNYILPLDNSHLTHKAASLTEFALKGY